MIEDGSRAGVAALSCSRKGERGVLRPRVTLMQVSRYVGSYLVDWSSLCLDVCVQILKYYSERDMAEFSTTMALGLH